MFINNDGPYIIYKEVSNESTNISHIINNIKLNSVYKINVQSIVNNILSANNIKEFMFNSYDDDLTIQKKNDFNNNIKCMPNGQHYSVDNCDDSFNNDISAKDSSTSSGFDESNYNRLMENLNKRDTINLALTKDTDFKYKLLLNK